MMTAIALWGLATLVVASLLVLVATDLIHLPEIVVGVLIVMFVTLLVVGFGGFFLRVLF